MASLISDFGRMVAQAASSASRPPVPYVARPGRDLMMSLMDLGGRGSMETLLKTMGMSGTVFSIVNLMATTTGAPDWSLYRKEPADGRRRYSTADTGSDQRTEVVNHAALKVWQNPNPFMMQTDLTEIGQQHLELVGEAYQVVTRDGGVTFPTGLWPVRPDRMDPVPDPDVYLKGWIYTAPSGEQIPLNVDEVIQVKLPNPWDPYRGLGPVQSVLVDIHAAKYTAEWNRNFFLNGATPGGVLMTPNALDDTEFDELMDRWRDAHAGVSRAHRVALLENGVTWQQAAITQRDMDFANLRQVSRDTILEAWGMPKSMLGIVEDVNRANAQTSAEVFTAWQISPRLKRWRTAANFQFLPLFGAAGQGVEFDFENPSPDDREADNAELAAKATAASVLVAAGYDPADVLVTVGLPAMGVASAPPQPPPAPDAAAEADSGPPDMTDMLRRLLTDGYQPVEAGRR